MKYRRLDAGEIVTRGDEYLWFECWRPVVKLMVGMIVLVDYNQFPYLHMMLMSAEGMIGVDAEALPYRRLTRHPKTPANPLTGKLLTCHCKN